MGSHLYGLRDDSSDGLAIGRCRVDLLPDEGEAALVLGGVLRRVLLEGVAVGGEVGLGPVEGGDVHALNGIHLE